MSEEEIKKELVREIMAKQQWYEAYQKEKEKNKLLINNKFREVADKNSYVKDNYIAKSKIKAKIEEYNKRKREKQGNYCTLDELIIDKEIQVLQELLEE